LIGGIDFVSRNNGRAASSRLDALMRRKAELASALRTEREKRKAIEEKERERLSLIVGRALLANAAQYPDFDLMLRGVLKTTIKPGSAELNYLKAKGWLQ
jgi:hypothetical protein